MNETRPHWAAWTEKLIIKLESAISLSLDREPKDGARRDGPGPDTEFLDRWRLVEHLIASGKLHVSGLHVCYGPRILGTANAREFAAALAQAGVALPGEFVRAWLGETLQPVQAPESASTNAPTPRKDGGNPGMTVTAILAHPWPVPDGVDLEKLLRDGRAKWLADARVSRGSRGKVASLWNPAMLAICMESKTKGKTWQADHHRLNNYIREHHHKWIDEWERLCEYTG